jgi:hypothetical protein
MFLIHIVSINHSRGSTWTEIGILYFPLIQYHAPLETKSSNSSLRDSLPQGFPTASQDTYTVSWDKVEIGHLSKQRSVSPARLLPARTPSPPKSNTVTITIDEEPVTHTSPVKTIFPTSNDYQSRMSSSAQNPPSLDLYSVSWDKKELRGLRKKSIQGTSPRPE